jgi:hypothetical protein
MVFDPRPHRASGRRSSLPLGSESQLSVGKYVFASFLRGKDAPRRATTSRFRPVESSSAPVSKERSAPHRPGGPPSQSPDRRRTSDIGRFRSEVDPSNAAAPRSPGPLGHPPAVYTASVEAMRPADHRVHLQVLSRMSPEARLRKAFELSELSRALFRHGLRRRFPGRDEAELRQLMRERLCLCHSRNS